MIHVFSKTLCSSSRRVLHEILMHLLLDLMKMLWLLHTCANQHVNIWYLFSTSGAHTGLGSIAIVFKRYFWVSVLLYRGTFKKCICISVVKYFHGVSHVSRYYPGHGYLVNFFFFVNELRRVDNGEKNFCCDLGSPRQDMHPPFLHFCWGRNWLLPSWKRASCFATRIPWCVWMMACFSVTTMLYCYIEF